MARKARVAAAAAGMAGLLALVVAVTRDTGTRRRLGGPGALPTHALLPEHQRKWVHPAGQPVAHHHVRIDTHDRTTGYKSAPTELAWLDGQRKGKICATQNDPRHVAACAEIKILRRVTSSTPSTRRLLDGVAMPVPRRSTEPGRPRHRREMT